VADAAGIFLADLLILTSNFPLKFFDIYPRMGISEYDPVVSHSDPPNWRGITTGLGKGPLM
jgi:hypothetical protein